MRYRLKSDSIQHINQQVQCGDKNLSAGSLDKISKSAQGDSPNNKAFGKPTSNYTLNFIQGRDD